MDLVGIEPTTSSMPWKRAPSCATGPLGLDRIILAYPVVIVKPGGTTFSYPWLRSGCSVARFTNRLKMGMLNVSFGS